MYSELVTRQRGILIPFIVSLLSVIFTTVGVSSPIDVEFHGPEFIRGIDKILPHYKGSGVVINKDIVLTAFHNIEFPAEGCGTWFTDLKVLAYDPKKDVCVIEYPTEGRLFSRLAPNPPKVGDRVLLVARFGTYTGTWEENPHYDDQMSIKFDGKRPRIGDSGGGVYLIESNASYGTHVSTGSGLVGIFLGFSGWKDGPEGEYSRIATWTTLKAFGIPVSGISAPVKPNPTTILPLPGTEDGQTPTQGGTEEEPEEESPTEEQIPEITGNTLDTDLENVLNPPIQGTVPPTAGVSDPQGTSLPLTPSKGGSTTTPKGDDMMEMLITAALGAAGITMTGGTGAAVYFGAKGLMALYRRRKKKSGRSDTDISSLAKQIEEVLGRKSSSTFPRTHIPGRKVDEIGELLQLAQLEGYDPLMGSTFGLFMQDEITQLLVSDVSDEQKDIVRKLYNSTMDRLNSAAPLVKGQ